MKTIKKAVRSKPRMTKVEQLLYAGRGYVSKLPKEKTAVLIVSGGLDSIATSARMIEDYGMELFPLHIHRGQTNAVAEEKSVAYFTKYFQKKYGKDKFHKPMQISVNVPPKEFKSDLIPYMKEHGYPMRDPLMHILGVEYAVAASQKYQKKIRTVLCAIMPEDYFPHSTLEGLRSTTLSVCKNMGDWDWNITSPNIDTAISKKMFGKNDEIIWSMERKIPIGKTISCNDACEKTDFLSCGICKSCDRRRYAFEKAGYKDPTVYYNEK